MAQEVIKVKLLYQFGIIMFVTFLGEFLHCLIPLPIPASIYGLLLMLAGLMTKVIKLEQVKIAADFLIEIMPPMFIPAAVGLIVTWSDLKVILVPVLVITCITTVFVMVVTGRTAQAVMHLKENMAGKGVKVVVIDSDVDSDAVSCRIGTDNYDAGCKAAEAAMKDENEEIHIGIVNYDKNSDNGQKREEGFRDTILSDERAGIDAVINVLSDTENAKKRTKKMLKKHPKINVIVTFNEWTTLGVGYAIQELGLKDRVRVVAFDSNVVSVGMLETGEVDTLIVQNSYAMGYLGVETAYKLINGYSIKDTIYTDTIAVDKENMYDEECQRRLFAFEKSNKN